MDWSTLRAYRWRDIRGALSQGIDDEARRIIDVALQARGVAATSTPDFEVVVRFQPVAAPPCDETPCPMPSELGLSVASALAALFHAPQPAGLLAAGRSSWMQLRESVEITFLAPAKQRVLMCGATSVVLRGHADARHVADVGSAVADLMAVLPPNGEFGAPTASRR